MVTEILVHCTYEIKMMYVYIQQNNFLRRKKIHVIVNPVFCEGILVKNF